MTDLAAGTAACRSGPTCQFGLLSVDDGGISFFFGVHSALAYVINRGLRPHCFQGNTRRNGHCAISRT